MNKIMRNAVKYARLIICTLFLLCSLSPSARAFQTVGSVALPKVEDVEKIETTNNKFRFQTPESLLRMLPNMIAVTPGNKKPAGYQYGTILLKDGTILKWRSSSYGNVFLSDGKAEQLYVEDESFWSFFLGKFVYTLVSFTLFALFLIYYFDYLRHQPVGDSVNVSNRINSDYARILCIRIAAFTLLCGLGYLLLLQPMQQISDGVQVSHLKGQRSPYISFADTEPGNFWFAVFLNASFGLLSIFFGTILLLINPKSKFWRRKSTTAGKPLFKNQNYAK